MVPEDRITALCDQLSVEKDPDKLLELLSELKVALREYSLKLHDMMIFHSQNEQKYKDKHLKEIA